MIAAARHSFVVCTLHNYMILRVLLYWTTWCASRSSDNVYRMHPKCGDNWTKTRLLWCVSPAAWARYIIAWKWWKVSAPTGYHSWAQILFLFTRNNLYDRTSLLDCFHTHLRMFAASCAMWMLRAAYYKIGYYAKKHVSLWVPWNLAQAPNKLL